jgi:ABC-type Zn uptake system ZnuABC Zn-binding protein ZnuA
MGGGKNARFRWYLLLLLLFLAQTVFAQSVYVTTIHPIRQIVRAVADGRAEVTGILPPNASPHTHELRPSEVRHVERAHALFYGSRTLDNWALSLNYKRKIALLDLISPDCVLDIEIYFGKRRGDSLGPDPHFWTDPLTVASLIPTLVDTLCALDPDGCSSYTQNALSFASSLERLDETIVTMLAPVEKRAVILSHPFFQYYLKRYQIPLAGIIETNPGREPTAKELKEIIQTCKEKKVKAIFTHPLHSSRAAELVAEATGLALYPLDPIGGHSGRESYADLLLYNTRILVEALR